MSTSYTRHVPFCFYQQNIITRQIILENTYARYHAVRIDRNPHGRELRFLQNSHICTYTYTHTRCARALVFIMQKCRKYKALVVQKVKNRFTIHSKSVRVREQERGETYDQVIFVQIA